MHKKTVTFVIIHSHARTHTYAKFY